MTARVKMTIEAAPSELMTAYRAGSDFLTGHASEDRPRARDGVLTVWNWHDGSRPPVSFLAWGDARHVRVRQCVGEREVDASRNAALP